MKNEIKVKETMEMAAVTKILRDLAASFDEGTICFEKGEEFVTLRPGYMIDLEIEAELKKDKQKLSIELCWRQSELKRKGRTPAIRISSQEPEMVAPTPQEAAEDSEGDGTESGD